MTVSQTSDRLQSSRLLSLTSCFTFALMFLNACGPEATPSSNDQRNVSLVVGESPRGGEAFGLTGTEPVFIGLGIRDKDGRVTTHQLRQGDNELTVPTGSELEFRASIYSRPSSGSGLVYSLATANTIISSNLSEPAEVSLQFEAYRQAKIVNVYGLVHETARRPKPGARVSVKDPISGALIRLEGLSSFSTTDGFGSYAFAFPVGLPYSSDKIELLIEAEQASNHALALSDSGLPGYTLEPINLGGDGAVVPAYANIDDYDGDGTLNLVEIDSGTNPFSQLSGAKGDKGDKGDRGDPGIATGMIVVSLPPGNTCPSGGQSFQAFRDANGNGIRESVEVTLGAPSVSCFPVPVVEDDDVLVTTSGSEVGALIGDSKQPIMETIFGHLVRLTQSGASLLFPERVNLHYPERNCAGQAHAPYLAIGQAAYPHASAVPVTTSDGRPVTLQSKSVRTTSGCQNVEFAEPLSIDAPNLVNTSGASSMSSDVGASFLTATQNGVYLTDGSQLGINKVGPGSYIYDLTKVGSKLFYQSQTTSSGNELWVSDGTAGGTTFIDVLPGSQSSSPYKFTELAGKLIFLAHDGSKYNLWSSDGTTAGTIMLKDFSVSGNYVSIESIWKAGSLLYINVYFYDGSNYQYQLWKSNGTPVGTVLVKDIAAGSVDGISQNWAAALGSDLIFTVDDGSGRKQIWKSNGESAGTLLLKTINATASANPDYFFAHGPFVYFVADDGVSGRELWRSDGTSAGTIKLSANSADFDCASGCTFMGQGSVLYAQSSRYVSSVYENILLRTDGSVAGTSTIATSSSISYGGIVDFARAAVSNNGTIFLPGNSGSSGWEPARLSTSGFQIIKDLNVGSGQSMGQIYDSRPGFFAKSASGLIYFSASESGGLRDLWRTDGTSAGTVKVLSRTLNDGLEIDMIAVSGDRLFFGSRPIGGGSSRQLHVFLEGISSAFSPDGYTRVLELDGPSISPGAGLSLAP